MYNHGRICYPLTKGCSSEGWAAIPGYPLTLIGDQVKPRFSALEMKLLPGCTGRKIEQKLGRSESAASMRISRRRKLLQEIVRKKGFEP